jgi:hypothetical protein
MELVHVMQPLLIFSLAGTSPPLEPNIVLNTLCYITSVFVLPFKLKDQVSLAYKTIFIFFCLILNLKLLIDDRKINICDLNVGKHAGL